MVTTREKKLCREVIIVPFVNIRKATLDWVLGGAAATRPGSRWISFATASPNDTSAFDGPFSGGVFGRATVTFAAANSPQMSVTNLNAFSNITATALATAVGWNLWNSSSGGTRIAYGTVTANIGCKSADNIGIAAGAINITLS
jgi:hypothetical protein